MANILAIQYNIPRSVAFNIVRVIHKGSNELERHELIELLVAVYRNGNGNH